MLQEQLNSQIFFFAYHFQWDEEKTLRLIPYRRLDMIQRLIDQKEFEKQELEKKK